MDRSCLLLTLILVKVWHLPASCSMQYRVKLDQGISNAYNIDLLCKGTSVTSPMESVMKSFAILFDVAVAKKLKFHSLRLVWNFHRAIVLYGQNWHPDHFTKVHELIIANLCKHQLLYNIHFEYLISSQFSTCHDISDVMACAKMWPDWISVSHVSVTCIFIKFGSRAHEQFVTWTPELRNSMASVATVHLMNYAHGSRFDVFNCGLVTAS